ncbi:MAG TPA: hypothetical protein VNX00_15585 [Herbaspirillum sp.]|jgi:hypothetical protein|nr:hypothetical protein [Herbaspirillum sp.]
MLHFGITQVQLEDDGQSVSQVLIHSFEAPANPERGDVVLEPGERRNSSAVAALIASGSRVYVIDEDAPCLMDEGDQVRVGDDGKLESFNPLGHASTSLQALPRMRE